MSGLTWKSPKGMATRFIVWRAYHRLAKALARPPFTQEIADEIGISRWHVGDALHTLETCELRVAGGTAIGDAVEAGYRHDPYTQPVDKLICDND